jgi:hypothetical protein
LVLKKGASERTRRTGKGSEKRQEQQQQGALSSGDDASPAAGRHDHDHAA